MIPILLQYQPLAHLNVPGYGEESEVDLLTVFQGVLNTHLRHNH